MTIKLHSWDGQVDSYIHISAFALKLSKVSRKAGLVGKRKLKKVVVEKKTKSQSESSPMREWA